jgi:hypothetical protein
MLAKGSLSEAKLFFVFFYSGVNPPGYFPRYVILLVSRSK